MKTNCFKTGSRRLVAPCPDGLLLSLGARVACHWQVLLIALLLGGSATLRAVLPAPDNVLYGIIVQGTNQVLADATEFAVEARLTSGLPVTRYRMGEQTGAGNHYLLTLPVEEIAPRTHPAVLLLNESVTVVLLSNDVQLAQQTVAVTERGAVRRLDFGILPPDVLAGFELWALAYGLDANSQPEDSDADGISNVDEFIAGTSPTNASSRFELRIAKDQGSPRVSFDALRAAGTGYEGRVRHYALEQLSDLADPNWQTVPGFADIVGADQQAIYTASATGGPVFFRGRAWLGMTSSAPDNEFLLHPCLSAGQRAISFTALGPDLQGRDRYYSLEYTTNLPVGPWLIVPGCSNLLGNNQTLTNVVPSLGTATFFRGRIELHTP